MSWRDLALELMQTCIGEFGQPIVYRHGGAGYGIIVTGAFGAATQEAPFGGLGAVGPAWTAEILRSALPVTPRESDTLDLPDPEGVWRRYTVNDEAVQDAERTTWTLKLKEEAALPAPTPALAMTILQTADGKAIDDVRLWNWQAIQTLQVGSDEQAVSNYIDLQYGRVVQVQADRPCWIAGGSATPVATVNGPGVMRIEAGQPSMLVVDATHRLAAICAPGVTAVLKIIPAS